MRPRSLVENGNIKWLWLGILSMTLVSCGPGTTPTNQGVEADAISPSPTLVSTATPIPATATSLPPSPTHTATLEPYTETPLPTETPTLTPSPWPTSEAFTDGARVSFINNAGFLITVGEVKILIDALYDGFNKNTATPPEVLQRAVNAEPPFDQVDLVLATHSHADHFSADLVRAHLRNNQNAVFVSSPDAVRQIERGGGNFAGRLVGVDLNPGEMEHLSIQGIELDCLYLTHGDDSILNIGMLITVDSYTFFHSGDMNTDGSAGEAVTLADLQSYGLPQKGIDLALLPSMLFLSEGDRILIEEGIHARYVSPMHYPYRFPPTGIEDDYPNAVVFKDLLASWMVPGE